MKPPFEVKLPGSYWRSTTDYLYISRHRVRGGHAYVVHNERHGRQASASHKLLDSRPHPDWGNPLSEVMNYPVDVEFYF